MTSTGLKNGINERQMVQRHRINLQNKNKEKAHQQNTNQICKCNLSVGLTFFNGFPH